MTFFHVLQLAFAAVALGVVVERVRFLFYVAPLDTKPWLRAVLDAIDEDDLATATLLVKRARPALIAEVAHAGLQARADGEGAGPAIDERASLAEDQAVARLRAVRVFASLGSATGLLGAAIELGRLYGREYGLAALQAGRAEALAISSALLAVVVGTAVSLVCWTAFRILQKHAAAVIADIRETAAKLHETLPV